MRINLLTFLTEEKPHFNILFKMNAIESNFYLCHGFDRNRGSPSLALRPPTFSGNRFD